MSAAARSASSHKAFQPDCAGVVPQCHGKGVLSHHCFACRGVRCDKHGMTCLQAIDCSLLEWVQGERILAGRRLVRCLWRQQTLFGACDMEGFGGRQHAGRQPSHRCSARRLSAFSPSGQATSCVHDFPPISTRLMFLEASTGSSSTCRGAAPIPSSRHASEASCKRNLAPGSLSK